MDNNNIQEQINDINRKLDIVLDEIVAQKQTRQSIEDLTADLTIISKDVFASTVTELDNASVEVDGEAVKLLLLKLVRNIDTLTDLFEMLESGKDLLKDLTPIIQQVGLDSIHMMNDFERKGYFEFIAQWVKIIDIIVANISKDDLEMLANNIVPLMDIIKGVMKPDVLKSINNALSVYEKTNINTVEEYSLFKAFRVMNSKDMRKGIGFMMTFLQELTKQAK